MTVKQYMQHKEQLGAVFAALGLALTDRQLFQIARTAQQFQPEKQQKAKGAAA